MAVKDSTGNVAVVTHPDSAVTAGSDWTEWRIPYGELTGIDLSRAAILYIGIGDRNQPTVGGTGLICVDDIGFGKRANGAE